MGFLALFNGFSWVFQWVSLGFLGGLKLQSFLAPGPSNPIQKGIFVGGAEIVFVSYCFHGF